MYVLLFVCNFPVCFVYLVFVCDDLIDFSLFILMVVLIGSRLDKKAAVALCDLSILLKLFPTSVSDCIDKHYHNDYVSDFSCLLLKVLTKLNDENLNSKKSPVRDAVDKLQSDFIYLIVQTYHVW